jgi:hypothetical protein
MPYIERKSQEFYAANPLDAKQPGDLTYVVYRPIYKMWKDEPRFKTWFALARGQRNPRLIPKPVMDVMVGLTKSGVLTEDVFAAMDCALLELWTRHVSSYEAKKLDENGDVSV